MNITDRAVNWAVMLVVAALLAVGFYLAVAHRLA
jgi:hypothetical protein